MIADPFASSRALGLLLGLVLLGACNQGGSGGGGRVILGVEFDAATIRNAAPGNAVSAPESDNWPITWSADGHQYTAFGDGRGFGTGNALRASLGVARIEGGPDDYSAFDQFKTGDEAGGFDGGSVGILALGTDLYLFRSGTGSGAAAFNQSELYVSTDGGFDFGFTGVRWEAADFPGGVGFFSPSFLQFGRGYSGARDGFVYIYANERTTSVGNDEWNVQRPGLISLLRVPRVSVEVQNAYEYFAGLDADGDPVWSSDLADREPVFRDDANGIMRTSVSFNSGLRRYLLITQQGSRFRAEGYRIGIYEAPEPWGPWTRILLDDPRNLGPGLNTGEKTVFWNFSNKWSSDGGRAFVLVYTGPGPDEWGTIEGRFITSN